MAFKDIVNQKKAKEIIIGQLKSGRIPHAYLFLGPEGVGRRKTALELAKSLNCQKNAGSQSGYHEPCDHCLSCQKINSGMHPDVQTIDFAWQAQLENKEVEKQKTIKIDTIRALQHEVSLKPVEGKWKIFLIEPADKITIEAANCLLKTLEEPPSWTMIILLAKHKENLPVTIVSRAQIVFFSPLSEHEITKFLVSHNSLNEARALEIAKGAEGSLSWALARMNEKAISVDDIWPRVRKERLSTAELLSCSQQYAKNAAEFLDELLSQMRADFRAHPQCAGDAIEAVIASQKLLTRNVNPQMVLDVLFCQLNKQAGTR